MSLAPTVLIIQDEAPTLRVQVAEFFLAYAAPGSTGEPTEEEYQSLANSTIDYFNSFFTDFYGGNDDVEFLGWEAKLDFARYNAGFPEDRYNVYLQFAPSELVYSEGSDPLDPATSFDTMKSGVSVAYILEYVRQVPGGAFSTVDEVLFRAVSQDGPVADNRSGVVNRQRRSSDLPLSALAASSALAAVLLFVGVCVYRRHNPRHPHDYADGIYSVDHKVLEGYFSENENTNSMTEVSESNYSRFHPLPRVMEETYEDESIHQNRV